MTDYIKLFTVSSYAELEEEVNKFQERSGGRIITIDTETRQEGFQVIIDATLVYEPRREGEKI